ncbi:hypothetical protein RJ639_016819, partial [Escallonia herrerae]
MHFAKKLVHYISSRYDPLRDPTIYFGDKVADVKRSIENAQGADIYPAAQQMLIHQGKVLKDGTTLEENKVAENSFVVIMLSKGQLAQFTSPCFKSSLLTREPCKAKFQCLLGRFTGWVTKRQVKREGRSLGKFEVVTERNKVFWRRGSSMELVGPTHVGEDGSKLLALQAANVPGYRWSFVSAEKRLAVVPKFIAQTGAADYHSLFDLGEMSHSWADWFSKKEGLDDNEHSLLLNKMSKSSPGEGSAASTAPSPK